LSALDEICPLYYGEDRIDLSLTSSAKPLAFQQVTIGVSYTRTLPQGVVLPLEMIVQGPSAQSYLRRVYSRAKPTVLLFSPKEGGSHLVLLREYGHNKWHGALIIYVDGPLLETPKS